MKIYNRIKLDIDSWEVLEEDSFDYSGDLILCDGTTAGTVTYGHHTDVDEDYALNFSGNITGWTLGGIPGDDNETIDSTNCNEICTFKPHYLGVMVALIKLGKYQTGIGQTPVIQYRTASTEGDVLLASWETYGTRFNSLGWIQIRFIQEVAASIRITNLDENLVEYRRVTSDGYERITE